MSEHLARAIEIIIVIVVLVAALACQTVTRVSVQSDNAVYGNQSVAIERTMDTK